MNSGCSYYSSIYLFYYFTDFYQLDLLMPGISPLLASSRKQILQSRKSLIKPALRPHFQQRRITLVEYFGFIRLRSALAIRDFLAISSYFTPSLRPDFPSGLSLSVKYSSQISA